MGTAPKTAAVRAAFAAGPPTSKNRGFGDNFFVGTGNLLHLLNEVHGGQATKDGAHTARLSLPTLRLSMRFGALCWPEKNVSGRATRIKVVS